MSAPDPLKLIALDAEDLAVISAHVQDARVQAADIVWRHTGGALYVWQMDGTDLEASSYLPAISLAWTIQAIGDFNGDGTDSIGLFRPSNTTIYLRNSLSTGNADNQFQLGTPNSKPVAGRLN